MSCKSCSEEHLEGRGDFQYSAKIVCGVVKPIPPNIKDHNSLPLGDYYTKVNIHNPSRCDCVTFQWKVAIGYPKLKVGPISDFAEVTLCPDEALEIDCADILKRLGGKHGHIEGWVVIETPLQLDIVAVYASAATAGGTVNTFHTERVYARCLPVCEDFDLDISTGVSAWEVKGPEPAPMTAYTLATLGSVSSAWPNLPGALWVHPASTSAGDFTYRLIFNLCSGFRNPKLNLCMYADYSAKIYLNGNQIGVTPVPGFTGPCTSVSTSSNFKAGINELIVVVSNLEELSATGLAIHGFIEVERGLCPGEPYPLLSCPEVCYSLKTRELWFNPLRGRFIDRDQKLEGPGCNNTQVGNQDGYHRAEQLQVQLTGAIYPGTSIEYRVFTRNLQGSLIGWSAWTSSGLSGLVGADKPITAIEIRLVNAPVNCKVQYRVATRKHLASYFPNSVVWSQYFYDGQTAGSTSSISGRYPPVVAVLVEVI